MKNILLILSLFIITLNSLKIEIQNEKKYISQEIDNYLNPFKINIEKNSENDLETTLTITCTTSIIKNFIFEEDYKNFCSLKNQKFTISELVSYLDTLSIKIESSEKKISNLFIFYNLKYNQNDLEKNIEIKQILTKPLFIPLQNNNNFIKYRKGTSFEKNIITIDPLYLETSDISNFELNKYYLFPDWVNYSFNGTDLILSGDFPDEFTDNLSLIFYLIDEKTKLSSKMITIWITGPNIFTKAERSPELSILMIFLFFLVLIILGMISYWRNKKRKKEEALKNSIQGEQNRKNNVPQTVLTDSIVNWNKKLLMKHKKSLKDSSNSFQHTIVMTEEESVVQNHFVKFDSENSFEVNRSEHSLKMGQRFSVIHAPESDDEKKNKSGFIDENPFN